MAGAESNIRQQAAFRQVMSVADIAGGLEVAGLDGIEKFAQVAGRVGDRFRRARKVVDLLAARPYLIGFVISDQGSFRPLEQTADVPHVLESWQGRGAKAVNIEQIRELQNGFLSVDSFGFVGAEKPASDG